MGELNLVINHLTTRRSWSRAMLYFVLF